MKIDIFQTPAERPAGDLADHLVVVTDVLRASTTMTAALAAGASGIAVFATVEEARSACGNRLLTGGERNGIRVEGFDLGNSPLEYAPERVGGKEIRFTTSNGTSAIKGVESAGLVAIGSFVNAGAVLSLIRNQHRPILVVCAGTDGKPTLEDSLFAGYLCHSLGCHHERGPHDAGIAARSVAVMWEIAERQLRAGKSLFQVLSHSPWAKRLLDLGRAPDVEYAATVDRFDFVPFLDRKSGLIVRGMAGRPVEGLDPAINSAFFLPHQS